MRTSLRRIALAAAAVIAVGATVALPGTAQARWHGGGWLRRTATAVGAGSVGASRLASRLGFGAPYYGGYMAAHITPMGAIASCAAAG